MGPKQQIKWLLTGKLAVIRDNDGNSFNNKIKKIKLSQKSFVTCKTSVILFHFPNKIKVNTTEKVINF